MLQIQNSYMQIKSWDDNNPLKPTVTRVTLFAKKVNPDHTMHRQGKARATLRRLSSTVRLTLNDMMGG
jgi:hypothetical protein